MCAILHFLQNDFWIVISARVDSVCAVQCTVHDYVCQYVGLEACNRNESEYCANIHVKNEQRAKKISWHKLRT